MESTLNETVESLTWLSDPVPLPHWPNKECRPAVLASHINPANLITVRCGIVPFDRNPVERLYPAVNTFRDNYIWVLFICYVLSFE